MRVTLDKVSETLGDHRVVRTEPLSLPITKDITVALQIENGEIEHSPRIIISLCFKNCSKEDKTFWIKTTAKAGNVVDFDPKLHIEDKSYLRFHTKANSQFKCKRCALYKDAWIKDDKTIVLVHLEEAIHYDTWSGFIEEATEEVRPMIFNSLFVDDAFKDIKFVIGDESLMAHKSVIANRSKVFRAMLTHDTKEKTDGVIEIKDSNFEVFKSFVQYLYTSQINDDRMTEEMLYLADKYDVHCLRTKCEKIVCRTMDETNAIDYLIKADAANFQLLKKRALEVISNNLSEIRKSEGFKQLSAHLQLLEEVYNVYFDQNEIIECNLTYVPVK